MKIRHDYKVAVADGGWRMVDLGDNGSLSSANWYGARSGFAATIRIDLSACDGPVGQLEVTQIELEGTDIPGVPMPAAGR